METWPVGFDQFGIQGLVGVGGGMIVAKRDQGAEFEGAGRVAGNFVFDYYGVLSVSHEDAFLDFHASDLIGEYGERVEAEVFQVLVTLGMDCAFVEIDGEFVAFAVQEDGFFQF